MKAQVIKSESISQNIIRDGILTVKQYINTPEVEQLSLALLSLKGKNITTRYMTFDSIYYIIKGSGFVTLNGTRYQVKAGDAVYIPRGTEYFDEGDLEIVVCSSPRFKVES